MDDVKVTLIGGPTLLLEIAIYRMITMGRSLVTDSSPRKSLVLAFEFDNVGGAPFQGWICRENSKTTSSIGRSEGTPDLQIHVAPQVLYDLWWQDMKHGLHPLAGGE